MESISFTCLLHCIDAAIPHAEFFLGASYLPRAHGGFSFNGISWADARFLDDKALQAAYGTLHHHHP